MEKLSVVIEGSGRHVHVTEQTLEALFGKGYALEAKKYLSQPGEFASFSKVDIIGPKGEHKGVSIIGPCRTVDQVELSFTDARAIGLDCPVRESGDVKGSAACTLVGPAGSVELSEGAIIAKRHLHMTPEDAEKYGIKDKQIIRVRVEGERAMIFDEVVARVSPKYATFMHVDYDEINAASLFGTPTGEVLLINN